MAENLIDASQLVDSDGVECTSHDEPPTDGAFKTRNLTPDEIQRCAITDRGSESYFKTSVRIITCIHGHMKTVDDRPSDPATLLVLEYKLHAKPRHTFDYVHTSFRFIESPRNSDEPARPAVIAYAPFSMPRCWDRTGASITKKRGFEGELGVSGGTPVSAKLSGSTNVEVTHLQQYFAQGSANIQYNDSTGLDDSVWWTLQQNSCQNHGVLPVFRVAMLVQRQSLSDFIGIFKMEIRGSFVYSASQVPGNLMRFLRHVPLDDPVNFSPRAKPLQGKVHSINQTSLGDLIKDEGNGECLSLPESYHLESFLPS